MHAIPAEPMDAREARRQSHRVYMASLAMADMLIESIVLGLFALAGAIPFWIALAFFSVSMTTSISIYLFKRHGCNLRLKDKGLLIPQMVINGAIQLTFLFLAPNLAILFLLALIALFGYAVIEFTPRQFTIGWLVFGASSAFALWLIRDRFGYPGTSGFDIILVWLFFFVTLRSLTFVSGKVSHLREKLTEKNRQLELSLLQIEELAGRDHLTGAFNRRNFMEMLEMEAHRAERTHQGFCFVMADLDHFKSINDRYGHPVGDEVLQVSCQMVAQSLRATDRVGRLGGEEFGILLPAISPEEAMYIMERLRNAVHGYRWEAIAPDLSVSFSAGIAVFVAGDTVQSLMKRADDALYRAKREGRNRVAIGEAVPSPQPAFG